MSGQKFEDEVLRSASGATGAADAARSPLTGRASAISFDRRAFAMCAIGVIIAPARALAEPEATLPMALGPFYPVVKPREQDADLTRLAGHKARAKGEVLELVGRVLDHEGRPVSNAKVELWQANAAGRYAHHGDDNPAPLDPDFQGYGVQTTDEHGRYRFTTVRPAPYPAGHYMRAAHIHFDVEGRYSRLITQMYFLGDRWLDQDRTLHADIGGAAYPDNIFGTDLGASAEPGARRMGFDIVLGDG